MKLGIGIPHIDRQVDRDFFTSFTAMQKPQFTLYGPTLDVPAFAMDVAKVRNSLVMQALTDDCTHLIMLDTDQTYPQDAIINLLRHDLDIVGPIVHRRYPPFAPIMYRGDIGRYQYVADEEMYCGDLIEVDATGCGCLCFNMDVFKRIPAPWFVFEPTPDGQPVGEDIRFCSMARSAGFKIHIDTSIEVGHLARVSINRAFYTLLKKMMPESCGADGENEREKEK